jgi:integrase
MVRRFERPADVDGADLVWADAMYSDLQRQLKRAAKQTGIDFPSFGFHTLRRTYATWRTMLGLSLRADEASVKAMGHASADMTAHYIQGKQTGMVEKLQNWVSFAENCGSKGRYSDDNKGLATAGNKERTFTNEIQTSRYLAQRAPET